MIHLYSDTSVSAKGKNGSPQVGDMPVCSDLQDLFYYLDFD
jgi:hypothetical protein